MTEQHQHAADAIRTLVNRLEAQIDDAFATASRLSVAAHDFGGAIGVTMRAGQPTVEHLSAALAAIGVARGHAIQTHRDLERIARMSGYGDGSPKPAYFEGEAGIAVVARAA